MSCTTPIFASQNQEENYNEEESFRRKRKASIMITLMSGMIFLGLVYYSGGFGYFSFPSIYIIIILIILFRVFATASRTRSRSRRRSQNYSQNEKRETYPLEHKPTTKKNTQKYCLQCGSAVDRNIDSLSMYYCSHCGYEIKNNRV